MVAGKAPAALAAVLALLVGPAWLPVLAGAAGPADGGDVAAEALAFAEANRAGWGLHPGAVLEVLAVRTSLTAEHAWLAQRLGGARVEDGGLAYHRPLDGSRPFAQARLAALPAAFAVPEAAFGADAAERLALAAVGGPALRAPARLDLRLALDPAPRLAWVAELATAQPRDWEVRLDALTGAVLQVRDARLRAEGLGQVFEPNPIASSGDGALRDNLLGLAAPELAAEMRQVPLRELSGAPGDAGFLAGPYVRVLGLAFAPDLRFQYGREDPRFEEVMVYHHVDEAQRVLRGLGFTDLTARQLPASNYPGEVNAFYSRYTRSLHFGYHMRDAVNATANGFADAAEDGEIIVHEYGHAILDDAVPGLAGPAGDALHEGFSDFAAASFLSRVSQGHFDPCVGDWFGQYVGGGAPPCLRRLDNTRRFPQDFDSSLVASPHENGLIWGGALWDLWQRFPREDVERVAIEAHFFLSTVPEMTDLGPAAVVANRLLGAPLGEDAVREVMAARGILGVEPGPQDDAGSGHDAGNHWRAALTLAPGTYAGKVGAHGDREDWYAFPLRQGDMLVLDVDALGAGPPGLVAPTDPALTGMQAGNVARLASPGLRALGPAWGCDATAGDLRFSVIATEDGVWRLYVPEAPDNDPLNPKVSPYAFHWRVTRDYAGGLPAPHPEVAEGAVRISADDELWVRLDGATSAHVVAPSGQGLVVSKGADQAVLIAHVALDGRVLGVRQLVGPPTTVSVAGNLLGEPADGTWVLRKGTHQTSGMAQGVQLRVAGKVLDDVAPQGEPIDGAGLGGPSATLAPLLVWNWHRSPARFDASSNDTLVPRPPVSPMCPRLLTS